MGLTAGSVGRNIHRDRNEESSLPTVALLGNPNVGKSSIFNRLTGLNQHTGNWTGKTVAVASGKVKTDKGSFAAVDLPGTYSLRANSPEEEIAGNYLMFEDPRLCLVVCDATGLGRGLPLVLQTMEMTDRVAVCLNLMDEAERRGISVDTKELSELLGVPVLAVSARDKKSMRGLADKLSELVEDEHSIRPKYSVEYPDAVERAVSAVSEIIVRLYKSMGIKTGERVGVRNVALRLLEGDDALISELEGRYGGEFARHPMLTEALKKSKELMLSEGVDPGELGSVISENLAKEASSIAERVTECKEGQGSYGKRERRVDKLLTGRLVGYPLMICLLLVTFWITITLANYPSAWLSSLFSFVGDWLDALLLNIGAPEWLEGLLIDGVYNTLAFVVSVMLPPMAIFFPLFTFLEDVGYLPRVAYNLVAPFKRCGSCGKQALTMCMGFGCNAAGVVGCRIISSPRERYLAMLTNSLVPCNGRFPTLIALITMFCVFAPSGSLLSSFIPAAVLTLVIVFGVIMTFLVTGALSKTLFKGEESSFILELPPYRPPRIGQIIVRSLLDRTLFVLGRAAAVAAPAGAVIWLMANISVGGESILMSCARFVDPLAMLIGLDGVMLMAFLLGFPANEIVLPIAVMAYAASGSISEIGALTEVKELLVANGWTIATAISAMIFSLFHWPCSTTVLTVKKETGSWRMALLSVLVPTATGAAVCMIFNFMVMLLS